MAPTYKLFCLTVSALLLLQLTDANDSKENDDQSPFLKNIDKAVNSKFARKASEAADILTKEAKKLANEFEDQLNKDYKKERDTGGIRILPKTIKYNVVQPGGAATKVALKRTAALLDDFYFDVMEKYDEKKVKPSKEEKPKIVKPFVLGAAIASVAAKNAKQIYGTGKAFWNDGKSADDKKDENNKGKSTRRSFTRRLADSIGKTTAKIDARRVHELYRSALLLSEDPKKNKNK